MVMKIYVVYQMMPAASMLPYEGDRVIGVFDSHESAVEAVEKTNYDKRYISIEERVVNNTLSWEIFPRTYFPNL